MPNIMSHQEWMELTNGGAFSVRSNQLKLLDAALAQFHRSPSSVYLDALRRALIAWMGDKGSDWRGSVRNGRGAVGRLQRELGLAGDPGGAIGEGLEAMRREPDRLMKVLFAGAQITWKNEFRGRLNRELIKPHSSDFAPRVAVRQFATSASNNKVGLTTNTRAAVQGIRELSRGHAAQGDSSPGALSQLTDKLIAQVVPPGQRYAVMGQMTQLLPDFMPQFIAAVTPVAGTLSSAGSALFNASTALYKHHGIVNTRGHLARSMSGSTVTQAVESLIRLLERERNADLFSAGVSLTEFGGKLAGTLLDGGTATTTAVGLAANIAKLLNIVRIVYRDVQEKDAANRMMQLGDLGPQTFTACPLLGCYIICCLPTSALMTLIADYHGQPGWMNLAESVSRDHLEPLRTAARKTLHAHRFEIRKLARYPGMLTANTAELDRMKENVGRSAYGGFGATI